MDLYIIYEHVIVLPNGSNLLAKTILTEVMIHRQNLAETYFCLTKGLFPDIVKARRI